MDTAPCDVNSALLVHGAQAQYSTCWIIAEYSTC